MTISVQEDVDKTLILCGMFANLLQTLYVLQKFPCLLESGFLNRIFFRFLFRVRGIISFRGPEKVPLHRYILQLLSVTPLFHASNLQALIRILSASVFDVVFSDTQVIFPEQDKNPRLTNLLKSIRRASPHSYLVILTRVDFLLFTNSHELHKSYIESYQAPRKYQKVKNRWQKQGKPLKRGGRVNTEIFQDPQVSILLNVSKSEVYNIEFYLPDFKSSAFGKNFNPSGRIITLIS